MSHVTLFLAVALILTARSAEAVEQRYVGAEARDPFSARLDQTKASEDPDAAEKRLRSLVVQGIVASSSNPRAIVNGRIYQVGNDLMPGIKITRIEKEGVFVMFGEQETVLGRPVKSTKGIAAQ